MRPASGSDEDVLRELEVRRCRAITEQDLETLEDLLADDLRHVHVTGTVQDKAGYLAALPGRPRRTERGPVAVRVLGDVAVMSGIQTNTRPGRPTDRLQVLQVWQRFADTWRLVDCCASGPISPGAP